MHFKYKLYNSNFQVYNSMYNTNYETNELKWDIKVLKHIWNCVWGSQPGVLHDYGRAFVACNIMKYWEHKDCKLI